MKKNWHEKSESCVFLKERNIQNADVRTVQENVGFLIYFYHPLLHNSDILKYLVWVSMAERSNVFLVLPDSLTSQLILTLKVLENKIVLAMGAEK